MQWRYSHLQPERHARPDRVGRTPSLPIQQAALAGPQLGLRRRQHRHLQHAGQQKEPDQRHQFATQPGSGRPWRRREIPAHHRGRALLSVDQRRPGRHGSRPGRLHHRLGRPAGAADRTAFSAARPWCGDLRPTASGPRDLTPGTTMDNVGGSMYWATTAELQSAIPGVPAGIRPQGLGLCRCRQRVSLQRADDIPRLRNRCSSPTPMSCAPRSARA